MRIIRERTAHRAVTLDEILYREIAEGHIFLGGSKSFRHRLLAGPKQRRIGIIFTFIRVVRHRQNFDCDRLEGPFGQELRTVPSGLRPLPDPSRLLPEGEIEIVGRLDGMPIFAVTLLIKDAESVGLTPRQVEEK